MVFNILVIQFISLKDLVNINLYFIKYIKGWYDQLNITINPSYQNCFCNGSNAKEALANSLAWASTDSTTLSGIIGPECSAASKIVAQFGNVYPLPQISGTSTASELSNFAAFARTCPSDSDQGIALSNFITYDLRLHDIFLIYELGNVYCEGLAQNFQNT